MKTNFLKMMILPSILFYGFLPRCVYHLPKVGAILLFILLIFLGIVYLYIRYMFVSNTIREKTDIILDTLVAVAGVAVACFFSYELLLPLLFCPAALPLYINNHKAMLIEKIRKQQKKKTKKIQDEMIDEIDFALFE